MAEWIKFVEIPTPNKTKTWEVRTIDNHTTLGCIKWFSRWRKYSFFPEPETVFETTCLHDIVEFIDKQMVERKQSRCASRQ